MSRVTQFLFDGDTTVRVIEENDRAAWITEDVCLALGLGNSADATSGLDEDEGGMATIQTPAGPQNVMVVYESGLYALILRGRKEAATRFRKWITSEVLPVIHRCSPYVSHAAIVIQKPCAERSLEELRIKLAKVNTAFRVFNKATAAWVWEDEGLPMPPQHLLPGWWQGPLFR
jgi:prophage antirepressor-like protein